ncbi:hypothetical protein THAOC_04777 [Thalassiosira oceanica]|uniref:Uncharacterized protein n=1 Tax=Thalassiosira oceanica TaxID=159749 RepID=K0T4C4_THAOC|nr:hypothetical protein THAOC_04777 [Thalassiosira oceanica]|eukprot:EJK73588.1 hypothetical protein THAOC_04777 [Thalassiosira oceanica]
MQVPVVSSLRAQYRGFAVQVCGSYYGSGCNPAKERIRKPYSAPTVVLRLQHDEFDFHPGPKRWLGDGPWSPSLPRLPGLAHLWGELRRAPVPEPPMLLLPPEQPTVLRPVLLSALRVRLHPPTWDQGSSKMLLQQQKRIFLCIHIDPFTRASSNSLFGSSSSPRGLEAAFPSLCLHWTCPYKRAIVNVVDMATPNRTAQRAVPRRPTTSPALRRRQRDPCMRLGGIEGVEARCPGTTYDPVDGRLRRLPRVVDVLSPPQTANAWISSAQRVYVSAVFPCPVEVLIRLPCAPDRGRKGGVPVLLAGAWGDSSTSMYVLYLLGTRWEGVSVCTM